MKLTTSAHCVSLKSENIQAGHSSVSSFDTYYQLDIAKIVCPSWQQVNHSKWCCKYLPENDLRTWIKVNWSHLIYIWVFCVAIIVRIVIIFNTGTHKETLSLVSSYTPDYFDCITQILKIWSKSYHRLKFKRVYLISKLRKLAL